MNSATQRSATRNQSTIDISLQNLFLGYNHFQQGVYKNTTGASLVAKDGLLVVRSTTVANGLESATSANLADVIGILRIDDEVTLAANATVNCYYATDGHIDQGLIIFPATVTIDTVVGNKRLKDILTGQGFDPKPVTETSKFDN